MRSSPRAACHVNPGSYSTHALVNSSHPDFRPVRTRAAAGTLVAAPDAIAIQPRDTASRQHGPHPLSLPRLRTREGRGPESAITAAITRLVQLSSRYAWPVILGFLLLAVVSASYFTRHFAMTTNSKKLLSSSLPWREQEKILDAAFPHRADQIIAVID